MYVVACTTHDSNCAACTVDDCTECAAGYLLRDDYYYYYYDDDDDDDDDDDCCV